MHQKQKVHCMWVHVALACSQDDTTRAHHDTNTQERPRNVLGTSWVLKMKGVMWDSFLP